MRIKSTIAAALLAVATVAGVSAVGAGSGVFGLAHGIDDAVAAEATS
jgi:hypothetical protein